MNTQFKNKKLIYPAGKIKKSTILNVYEEIKYFIKLNKNFGPFERHKPHLLLPSVYDLSKNEIILKNVKSFLGKDFFLWYSVFFLKSKSSEQYIPWHYDDYFWSILGQNGCTVWVAIDDVDEEMGPMEFCFDPIGDFTHQVETNSNNILSRGNTSNFNPKKETEVLKVCLKQGEFSIHSNKVWHRSGTNKSNKDRIAIAFRYITIDAYPTRLKFIKRGAIGTNFNKKYFSDDQRPNKIYKPLRKRSHLYSIFISLIITAFGDDKRNLFLQIRDLLSFIFSMKCINLILKSILSFSNKNKNGLKT